MTFLLEKNLATWEQVWLHENKKKMQDVFIIICAIFRCNDSLFNIFKKSNIKSAFLCTIKFII